MKDLNIFFPKSEDEHIHASCFIGINGSGKSQALEIIAEIFLFLDRVYRKSQFPSKNLSSPFGFRIEYEIILSDVEYLVIFDCTAVKTKAKDIIVEVFKKGDKGFVFNDMENLHHYLPNKVVGYTSGANETLSLPFEWYYDEYAKFTGDRAKFPVKFKDLKDYDPMLYFMNYNTNLGITISSLIFEDDNPSIKVLKDGLKIKKLISFRITIQTNQKTAPGYVSRPDADEYAGIALTEELRDWREKLIKCNPKALQDINDKKFNRWILDFELNETTKALFRHHFKNSLELYTALYKLELLNNLTIKDEIVKNIRRLREARLETNLQLVPKLPMVPDDEKVLHYSELKLEMESGHIVDYLSLSDGEHQFLNVFGTMLMIDQDNCLFLLDEPETHFNPKWRRTFISTLKEITKSRKQDVIVTSHSPFIISDTKNENVFIFRRTDGKIEVSEPPRETYGASFDNILDMAFDIKIPISEDSLNEIEKLDEETNPKTIQNELNKFGESFEKTKLLNRVILLNANKGKV